MRQLYLELYLALLAALLVRHTHAVMCKEITSSNWTNLGSNKCPNGTVFKPDDPAYSAEGQSAAQYQSYCCQVSRPRARSGSSKLLSFFFLTIAFQIPTPYPSSCSPKLLSFLLLAYHCPPRPHTQINVQQQKTQKRQTASHGWQTSH
jgi:hypothetical protein